jgi:hypothetical protein
MRSAHGLGQSHRRREGAIQNLADSHQTRAGALYVQAIGRNGERRELGMSQQKVGLLAQSSRQAVYQRAIVDNLFHSRDARISCIR